MVVGGSGVGVVCCEGRGRRERGWRGVGEKKQGGAHGSNMQPLCHGNAVKFVI
eukprot:COSAG05_NODE_24530_length_251_cov_0.493421_1_plen_52_part_01